MEASGIAIEFVKGKPFHVKIDCIGFQMRKSLKVGVMPGISV